MSSHMGVKGDKYFAGNALKNRGMGFVAPLSIETSPADFHKHSQTPELKYIVILNIN